MMTAGPARSSGPPWGDDAGQDHRRSPGRDRSLTGPIEGSRYCSGWYRPAAPGRLEILNCSLSDSVANGTGLLTDPLGRSRPGRA